MGHGLEPPAEAALRIVVEIAELAGEFQQDLLSDIFGVGVL